MGEKSYSIHGFLVAFLSLNCVLSPTGNEDNDMLAALPEKNNSLELIRLALKMMQSQQDATQDLKEYFVRVIKEAKKLSNDPVHIDPSVLPESIELALRMKITHELSMRINQVDKFENMTPKLAGDLLRNMEKNAVYTDQPAPST